MAALKVVLEDENRNVVSSLSDPFYINPLNDLKGFKLLCYIDPYGDTIFNRMQMDDLIKDLILLSNKEKNPQVNEIKLLAEQCKMNPHTYVSFYGD